MNVRELMPWGQSMVIDLGYLDGKTPKDVMTILREVQQGYSR